MARDHVLTKALKRLARLGLAASALSLAIAVTHSRIDDAAASRIAALSVARATTVYRELDPSRMPPPVMSLERGKRIFDVRDEAQNVWFVVIIDAAGGAEVSAMQLGGPQ